MKPDTQKRVLAADKLALASQAFLHATSVPDTMMKLRQLKLATQQYFDVVAEKIAMNTNPVEINS